MPDCYDFLGVSI